MGVESITTHRSAGIPAHERMEQSVWNQPPENKIATYVIRNPAAFFMVAGDAAWEWSLHPIRDPQMSDEENDAYLEEREEHLRREEITPGQKLEADNHNGWPDLIKGDHRIRYDRYSGEIAEYREVRRFQGAGLLSQFDLVFKDPLKKPKERKSVSYFLFPSVERAIRSDGHIVEKHFPKSGETTRKIVTTIMVTRYMLEEFIRGRVTVERLSDMHQVTEDILGQIGMPRSRLHLYGVITDQLLHAAHKDSRDNLNPLVSRTLLGLAFGEGSKEQLRLEGVFRAFKNRRAVLEEEREKEREHLDQARIGIKRNFGLWTKRKDFPPISYKDAKHIVRVTNTLSRDHLSLDDILVAPYRPYAAMVRLLIHGTASLSESELPMYKSLVGNDFFESAQINCQNSIAELVQQYPGNPREVQTILRNRGIVMTNLLTLALTIGELNMRHETDTDYTEAERAKESR